MNRPRRSRKILSRTRRLGVIGLVLNFVFGNGQDQPYSFVYLCAAQFVLLWISVIADIVMIRASGRSVTPAVLAFEAIIRGCVRRLAPEAHRLAGC